MTCVLTLTVKCPPKFSPDPNSPLPKLADPSKRPKNKKSPYTVERGMVGGYEGETVTRRAVFTGGALAAGGIASALFALPPLGFAVGPLFEQQNPRSFQDVGPESDFNPQTYVPKVITIGTDAGEAGKTTIYVRKYDPARDTDKLKQPYVVVSTRCAHAGCPVRYVQAAQRFICPCHGGVYDFDGKVAGGPPVRPLDRFDSKVENGRVLVGARFSLDSKLERHKPRDPGEHLDGLWQYLYPSRPTT
ncbi:MAG: menaquinol-cytochrome c reductase iron-sulfur subunit [Thermoleophilaceae bacterium]|nr:menaquinol-cytochrome c reductase iron-sulfur subunit [Thermoleophilaceae bacterium]